MFHLKGNCWGYIGGLFGMMGWIIGLTAVGFLSDSLPVLLMPLLIGTLISLGFFFISVFLTEFLLEKKHFGKINGVSLMLALWGICAFFVGILALLCNYWIAPIIDQTPALLEIMHRFGSVYRMNDSFSLVWLVSGVICFVLLFIQILRGKQHE